MRMTPIMTTTNKLIHSHVLGLPRHGADLELQRALEANRRGELPDAGLEAIGRDLRARHWALQRRAGLDHVSVGDFAYCDQVANHVQLLGCEPARYGFTPEQARLSRYFAMARGLPDAAALETRRWFDTTHSYLVPEFTPETAFSLACERLFDEVAEAQALGHPVKAVLLGPLSFLWLGKETAEGFSRLALLDKLLPVYGRLLDRLKAQGVPWVQLDEPILGLDLPPPWRNAFENVYWQLNQVGVPMLLATYFSPLEENLSLACRLPVAGLHVDGVRAPHELVSIADWLPVHKVLSIGIVDGRKVWHTDLDQALAVLAPLLDKRAGKLWLSASCPLLHTPPTPAAETAPDGEPRSWLAFATGKLDELRLLKQALQGEVDAATAAALARSRAAMAACRASARVQAPPDDAGQRRRQAALAIH
jgi:5-methyltetrahydropteroyltriglutamate--homocysteine methyltransferase